MVPFARRGPTSESGPSMRAVRDLPIPPAEKVECAEGKIPEREYKGLMVSCARATRGLRRPSLGLMARLGVPVGGPGEKVARSGRPNRPPSKEKERQARKYGNGRKMAAPVILSARGTPTMKRWSFDARSGGSLEAVLSREGNEQVWREHRGSGQSQPQMAIPYTCITGWV